MKQALGVDEADHQLFEFFRPMVCFHDFFSKRRPDSLRLWTEVIVLGALFKCCVTNSTSILAAPRRAVSFDNNAARLAVKIFDLPCRKRATICRASVFLVGGGAAAFYSRILHGDIDGVIGHLLGSDIQSMA